MEKRCILSHTDKLLEVGKKALRKYHEFLHKGQQLLIKEGDMSQSKLFYVHHPHKVFSLSKDFQLKYVCF